MHYYYTREMMDMFKVSRKQLRYYEERGLLRNVPRNEKNGYRYYTIEHVKQMIAIIGMKDLDLTSEMIRKIMYSESVLDVKDVLLNKMIEAKDAVTQSMNQYNKAMEVYSRILEGVVYNSSPEYKADENGNLGIYEIVTVPPRDVISLSYMETFDDPDNNFIRQAAEIQCMADMTDVIDRLNVTFVFCDHFDTVTNTFDDRKHLTKVMMKVQSHDDTNKHHEHLEGFRGVSTLHRGFFTEGLRETYYDLIEWGKSQGFKLKNISYEEWNLSSTISNVVDNWLMRIIIPIDE